MSSNYSTTQYQRECAISNIGGGKVRAELRQFHTTDNCPEFTSADVYGPADDIARLFVSGVDGLNEHKAAISVGNATLWSTPAQALQLLERLEHRQAALEQLRNEMEVAR